MRFRLGVRSGCIIFSTHLTRDESQSVKYVIFLQCWKASQENTKRDNPVLCDCFGTVANDRFTHIIHHLFSVHTLSSHFIRLNASVLITSTTYCTVRQYINRNSIDTDSKQASEQHCPTTRPASSPPTSIYLLYIHQ